MSIEMEKIEPGANYFIALSPLTGYLKMLNIGYEEHVTKNKISHLLFIEDLRLIGKRKEDRKKSYKLLKPLVLIFIWNCGLKM
jgi:hypothetical protein